MKKRKMESKHLKPTIVLFDMDGTTVRHVNPKFLGALETVDNFIYWLSRLFSRKRKITDTSKEPQRPRGLLVHRLMHKFRRKEVDQIVQPCPGIFLLLNLFRENNIPLGIVSNSIGQGYGHEVLETFKLAEYFDVEIFREDIIKSKPNPDPILRGLRAIKAEPEAHDVVWYIGDRHTDVQAALAADSLLPCKIIPFSHGLNAAMQILRSKVSTDNIIVTYQDFYLKIRDLFDDKEQRDTNELDGVSDDKAA